MRPRPFASVTQRGPHEHELPVEEWTSMDETKVFFVTTAPNHPRGSGYWEVAAPSRDEAHDKAMDALDGKWAMMYESLDDIHPLDRKRHGRIG